MKVELVPVRIGRGIIVMHTREEWERFWKGVDREIATAADSATPLVTGEAEDD